LNMCLEQAEEDRFSTKQMLNHIYIQADHEYVESLDHFKVISESQEMRRFSTDKFYFEFNSKDRQSVERPAKNVSLGRDKLVRSNSGDLGFISQKLVH